MAKIGSRSLNSALSPPGKEGEQQTHCTPLWEGRKEARGRKNCAQDLAHLLSSPLPDVTISSFLSLWVFYRKVKFEDHNELILHTAAQHIILDTHRSLTSAIPTPKTHLPPHIHSYKLHFRKHIPILLPFSLSRSVCKVEFSRNRHCRGTQE